MDKRKSVVVLNSPLFKEDNPRYDEDSLPPIGLGIIATAIRDAGHCVKFIDAVAENIPLANLIETINSLNPDFLCLNIFSTNLILVHELVEGIKCDLKIIIGGLATKDLRTEIFSWKTKLNIDIVHGDGELIVLDLMSDSSRLNPLFTQSSFRYFLVDQNSEYYVKDISHEVLDRSFFTNEPIIHPFGFLEATVITSRGCIYNCAFCAAAQSVNRDLGTREKSIESVIAEIKSILSFYPDVHSIRVLDDLFLKNANSIDRAIEIFSQFEIKWRAMAHVETFKNVSEETVQKLVESGCHELFIGIESGSPEILKKIHKSHNCEKIKRSITLLLKNGINVKGYFIYGFPGETEADFEKTFQLASYFRNYGIQHNTTFRTSVFQYRPYHGTELFHQINDAYKNDVNHLVSIEPNPQLSDLIGRLQFNFHSGNYSNETTELVQQYILNTTNLNSLRIFDPNTTRNEGSESN